MPMHNITSYIGRITRFSKTRDTFRRYVTDAPSPEQFANWLRSVDNGDIAALTEMQEEMEAKDAHLQGVANTRRASVTALEWEIVAESDTPDPVAEAVATYVRNHLRAMRNFETTLRFLQTAIGPNISVVELIWHRGNLADFVLVPGHRLTRDPFEGTGIRIVTEEDSFGVPIKDYPHKFVVHHPESSPFPLRRTMTHATVWPYLVIHFTRQDWMAFSELYGSPLRVAKYDDTVIDEDRTTVQEMLDNMGSDTAATLPDGVDVELLSATGQGETYVKQAEWAEKKIAILWLGQTLTTDIGDRGSFAAAKVHDNVRTDLLLADLKSEERMVREQILRPMVRYRFPNQDVPVPYFRRLLHERKDLEASRLRAEQLRLANELGLPIPTDEAYEALNFTRPQGFDKDAIGGSPNAATDTAEQ